MSRNSAAGQARSSAVMERSTRSTGTASALPGVGLVGHDAAVLSLLGTLLLSLFVALLAALQLADHFRAVEASLPVFAALAVFGAAVLGIFMAVSATSQRVRSLNLSAAGLVLAVAAGTVAWIAAAGWLSGRTPPLPDRDRLLLALGFAAPAVLLVLVQWGLMRRRWLRLRGEEELGLWPWGATAIAGFAVLNPLGLEVLATALGQGPGGGLRPVWAAAALGSGFAAVVMAALECYIRSRMLRRRLAQSTQPAH